MRFESWDETWELSQVVKLRTNFMVSSYHYNIRFFQSYQHWLVYLHVIFSQKKTHKRRAIRQSSDLEHSPRAVFEEIRRIGKGRRALSMKSLRCIASQFTTKKDQELWGLARFPCASMPGLPVRFKDPSLSENRNILSRWCGQRQEQEVFLEKSNRAVCILDSLGLLKKCLKTAKELIASLIVLGC